MIKKFVSLILVAGIVSFNLGFLMVPRSAVAAGAITSFSDTVSNSTAGVVANHTIKFTTPAGFAGGATIVLTFTGVTIPGTLDFNDFDITDDGLDFSLAATAIGAGWGVNVNSGTGVITLTNGSSPIGATSVIAIEIGLNATYGVTGTRQITNGSAGTAILRANVASSNELGTLSVAIIPNSIVAVSAEVSSSLNFSISSNALYFGNLNSTGACFAKNTDPGYVTCPQTTEAEAFNMVAGTNGATGYTISVQGDTLKSGVNTIPALSANTASAVGTEQFGMRMTSTGGSGTVSVPYAAAGFAYAGTPTVSGEVARSTIPSANTTYSVRYLANISAVTKAGSYNTSHTYVATGNF